MERDASCSKSEQLKLGQLIKEVGWHNARRRNGHTGDANHALPLDPVIARPLNQWIACFT